MFRRLNFVFFIIGFSLFGATQASQIKLQTVFEKTFEDTIVDVIFDTATVSLEEAKAMGWKEETFALTEKAKGKVTIPYPCVLITKEKVSFLDKQGKEKKSIKMLVEGVKWEGKEGVHIGKGRINVRKSKNGEYLALAIPREGTTLGEGEKGDLAIYRKDGKEMWRLENVYLSDGYIIPSPNGEYAITLPPGEYPAGAPAFYSKEGIKYLKVREWNNGWKRGYAVEDFDFSEDGEYLVIGVSDNPVPDTGFVVLFNSKGEEIWVKNTGKGAMYVQISKTGRYIVATATDRGKNSQEDLIMFSLKGNLLWKKTFPYWDGHTFKFDDKENQIYFTSIHHNYLKGFNTSTGELVTDIEDTALRRIGDIMISDTLLYLQCDGYINTGDAVCVVTTQEKKVVVRKEYPMEQEVKIVMLKDINGIMIVLPNLREIKFLKFGLVGGEK